jgi:hypothetical protein
VLKALLTEEVAGRDRYSLATAAPARRSHRQPSAAWDPALSPI